MEAPFAHIDPSPGRQNRIAHVVLVAVGTLLMVPAMLLLFGLSMLFAEGYGHPTRPLEWAAILSAVAGSTTGGLAWCALCLLFFKRADLRWQRAAWSLCALHGAVTLPGIVGWSAFLVRELAGRWPRGDINSFLFLLMFLAIVANSIACLVIGIRNARLAQGILRRHRTEAATGPPFPA